MRQVLSEPFQVRAARSQGKADVVQVKWVLAVVRPVHGRRSADMEQVVVNRKGKWLKLVIPAKAGIQLLAPLVRSAAESPPFRKRHTSYTSLHPHC